MAFASSTARWPAPARSAVSEASSVRSARSIRAARPHRPPGPRAITLAPGAAASACADRRGPQRGVHDATKASRGRSATSQWWASSAATTGSPTRPPSTRCSATASRDPGPPPGKQVTVETSDSRAPETVGAGPLVGHEDLARYGLPDRRNDDIVGHPGHGPEQPVVGARAGHRRDAEELLCRRFERRDAGQQEVAASAAGPLSMCPIRRPPRPRSLPQRTAVRPGRDHRCALQRRGTPCDRVSRSAGSAGRPGSAVGGPAARRSAAAPARTAGPAADGRDSGHPSGNVTIMRTGFAGGSGRRTPRDRVSPDRSSGDPRARSPTAARLRARDQGQEELEQAALPAGGRNRTGGCPGRGSSSVAGISKNAENSGMRLTSSAPMSPTMALSSTGPTSSRRLRRASGNRPCGRPSPPRSMYPPISTRAGLARPMGGGLDEAGLAHACIAADQHD